MWLSLWLFLEDPHHRIGGVAWNGLFQALVVPLGALLSIIVFLSAAAGTLPRRSGVLVALAMGATALYCIRSVFSILMGV